MRPPRACGKVCAGLPEVVTSEWLAQEIVIRLSPSTQRIEIIDQNTVHPWTIDA